MTVDRNHLILEREVMELVHAAFVRALLADLERVRRRPPARSKNRKTHRP